MAKRRLDPKKFSKNLGLKIRQLRQERGWTLEDTEEFGIANWTHLQRIEAGKNINLKTLILICNMFGLHPSELLEGI
jgi:DNA-binding Xre family transcriptional regulator